MESTASLRLALERDLETDCGLSVPWFEVLLRLARSSNRRLRMSDLAAQTTLTRSGLSRAVDNLEAAGLVRRATCPTDGRGAFAELTPAGLSRIRDAIPAHLDHLERHLTGVLTERDQRNLAAIARRLRDHLNPDAASSHHRPVPASATSKVP